MITFVICGGCYDMAKQCRKWQLTINNPIDHGLSHKDIFDKFSEIKKLNYWCLCDEIGENGTYHTHIFIYRVNPVSFDYIKNYFL